MSTTKCFLLGALVAGCAQPGPAVTTLAKDPVAQPSETDREIAQLAPTAVRPDDTAKRIDLAIESHFQQSATRRGYVMTDKPLYQPGETIWFRADLRATGTLIGAGPLGLTMQLVSPRGAVVAQKRVLVDHGIAANDFELAPDLEGGEYTLQLAADDGTTDQRKIVVNTYEAPRLMKTIEMLRKAYGEGDQVSAAVEIKRATGEAFADRTLIGVVTVDDTELARIAIKTDKDGKAIAKFALPAHIARGDGLLTVLAEDGGVTESIQKRIPIVMKTLDFAMFPEGGDLVDGLASRVYFMAKNTLGKPADIEGRVVDDRGQEVATLRSIHDGMGRFELEPRTDRSYHVEITRPAGITAKFAVPAAKTGGCALRAVEPNATDKLRVAATCTTDRELLVEAMLREKHVSGGALDVEAGKPALIELPIDPSAQGAVRVTLFSAKAEPLAERLVYHGRGQDLKVTMTADKKTYAPRDPVKLKIHAADASGRPVKADLGLSVVDDTVLSFADDKSARILAHLFLEPELGATADQPIEEPNFYFSDKPEASQALDALLATRGYRRFEWQPVLTPPPVSRTDAWASDAAMPVVEGAMAPRAMEPAPPPPAAPGMAPPADGRAERNGIGAGPAKADVKDKQALGKKMPVRGLENAKGVAFRGHAAMDNDEEIGDQIAGWAPVRVFPVPAYHKGYDGPRTDFRETIYWNPHVTTDGDGNASVAFFASDAITSFRAIAEGASAGGTPGGGEATIQSKMPLTLEAKLPVEVTSGDVIKLPVTLANETAEPLDADLTATFGAAFKLAENPAGKIHLGAGEKRSVFFPLEVVATAGNADVDVAIATLGLKDEIKKQIRVVPQGFPFEIAASGTAHGGRPAKHDFDLTAALPGSIHATVTMYPSPLASMTKGMEGMIREPGGCFEQTSSSNYPNVMIMAYLGANDAADPALVQKTQTTLDRGYKLLTGYETPEKGYEWFGHNPGHEALTAYGLMEFADMAKVYDVDHKMVERTADWLMSRRDHKGGFQRSSEALDSFGRAGAQTTNAYIMWALSEAKRTSGLDAELAMQNKLGLEATDPYLLALATNTALLAGSSDAPAMVKRLIGMQAKDGSFTGAKESITMSGGESLTIETTSLAVLALVKASPSNEYETALRAGVDWLNTKRGGYGEWGNTQGTILGLKALTAYADHARQMQSDGTATLVIDGKDVGAIHFEKGRKDALVWDDLAGVLVPGHNTVEVRLDGAAALPYTISVEYRAKQPQSSDKAKVSVATQLGKAQLKMGDAVKLHAHVENRTADGIPMTLARIGIPGGLVFQTWQLKELRDKGVIDFYETRPREVIVYWRAMAPSAKKDVELDLLAAVPGTYEAPASSAYLYYTAEDKAWTVPVKVAVDR